MLELVSKDAYSQNDYSEDRWPYKLKATYRGVASLHFQATISWQAQTSAYSSTAKHSESVRRRVAEKRGHFEETHEALLQGSPQLVLVLLYSRRRLHVFTQLQKSCCNWCISRLGVVEFLPQFYHLTLPLWNRNCLGIIKWAFLLVIGTHYKKIQIFRLHFASCV